MASSGGYIGAPTAIWVEEIDWEALESAWNCAVPSDARVEIEQAHSDYLSQLSVYGDALTHRKWHDGVRQIENSLRRAVSIRDKIDRFYEIADGMDGRLGPGLSERLYRQLDELELLADDIATRLGPCPTPPDHPKGPRPKTGVFRGFVSRLWEIAGKHELPRGSLGERSASPFERALHCLAPQGKTIDATFNKFRNERRHMQLSDL